MFFITMMLRAEAPAFFLNWLRQNAQLMIAVMVQIAIPKPDTESKVIEIDVISIAHKPGFPNDLVTTIQELEIAG